MNSSAPQADELPPSEDIGEAEEQSKCSSEQHDDLRETQQPTERAALRKTRVLLHDVTVFPMLGALTFVSKLLMEWAPNVHLIAMFIVTFTLVYRAKALIPLYVFVFLTGVYGGFNVWWVPYLYIWLPLWAVAMILPRRMHPAVAVPVYMAVCSLHGLAFGTLYAPAQALFFHYDFQTTVAWIVAGLPWDAVHAAGNLAAGTLVVPLTRLIRKLEKRL